MKKFIALLLSVLMMTAVACAAPIEHAALQSYVAAVNESLATLKEGTIDMVYEQYPAFVSLGMDGADTPDTVEMYFTLADEHLVSLQLRVADAYRFAPIAAACLWAASPAASTIEQAQRVTGSYAATVLAAPATSFEEDVVTLQGDQPRAYFAYYPNQYANGRSWLQMTLVFARPGSEGGAFLVPTTPAPASNEEPGEDDLQGYFSQDNYNHLEVFVTPTPEPDSAAME